MKAAGTKAVRAAAMTAALATALLAGACQPLGLQNECCQGTCGDDARVCRNPSVRCLAQDLDELDCHIERYGSVVASQPSVWGQARLTRHREEFEKQMAAELGNFQLTLQGSLSRSDQAYLATAVALGLAASGPTAGAAPPAKVVVSNSTAAGAVAPTAIPVPQPDLPQAFGAFDKITRTDTRLLPSVGYANIAKGGLTLEPTIYLDQKARYLNHLQELRRINEGDDTADSPGYSLNLVRIPVSVLPGKCTDRGYGAEVTMTLTPYLSDELLPTTFRNLIINDLIDQIGVPLTEFLNDSDVAVYLNLEMANQAAKGDAKIVQAQLEKKNSRGAYEARNVLTQSQQKGMSFDQILTKHREVASSKLPKIPPSVSATRLKHAKRPFPPSQILDIYGPELSLHVARTAYDVFDDDLPNTYYVHYPDVQGYLQEELDAAYKFLAHPDNATLWQFCNPHLVAAIRGRHIVAIQSFRDAFNAACCQGDCNTKYYSASCDTTKAFAWAIIVEAALLNEQLVQDMREAAAAKACCQLPCEWLPYFLPCPPPDARRAFNDYVRCRWPIHVFALDPVNQDQNIADTFSLRREMQLAVSLAFVSGQISTKEMTRYARRIEAEIETIALNSTAVGFSHGNETFGWRFYPRFQTPDIESNAAVLCRDLIIGGPDRDALLRQRRMEPGQRECVAVVIMPSFVPYCQLDVSSNWFPLDRCHQRVLTNGDAVRLSEKVKSIHNCAHHVGDADCYRPGELERLVRRAEQLEARLPLQSTMVQVPYENTLGGFAMFNTGITDLAPELLGWYGAPAVSLDAPTTVFLIGNHFSVHQTRVIVGGKEISAGDQEMLSRQVMKVTIPAGTLAITGESGRVCGCTGCPATPGKPGPAADVKPMAPAGPGGMASEPVALLDNQKRSADQSPAVAPMQAAEPEDLFVDIHVATPYGVTTHLLIPACKAAKAGDGGDGGGAAAAAAAAAVAPAWINKEINLAFVYKGVGIDKSSPPFNRPHVLQIQLPRNVDVQNGDVVTLTKMKLGSGASGMLPDLKVTVSKDNYTAATRVLKLLASDVETLAGNLFTELKDQFGPEATRPPTPVALAQASIVVGTNETKLSNSLTISWTKAAGASTPAPAGSATGS
jgi:hypothetical protein